MNQLGLAIKVDKLEKTLGPNRALKGISTFFEPGTMHGLIGPEGAGKTTLFRHMIGLMTGDKGSVTYFGGNQIIDFNKIRSEIAYMPQQQSLYADLSIYEHLLFFKDLYRLSEDVFTQRSQQLLEITRLDKFKDRPAGKLSGGMYKKLGLMCALLQSPNILLLDEPTNGVDPISRREFWDLLYKLREQKILIIVATAYMDEAERCSKVHLLSNGVLIGTGTPAELLKQENVRSFDEYFLKQDGSYHV